MRRPRSFRAKNNRRLELIRKKYGDGLFPHEVPELERLHREVGEWMAMHHPRDTSVLDDMRDRIAALRARKGGVG